MRLPPKIPSLPASALVNMSADIRTFVEMITLLRQRHITDASDEVREQIHSLLSALKEKKKQFMQEIASIAAEEEGELA